MKPDRALFSEETETSFHEVSERAMGRPVFTVSSLAIVKMSRSVVNKLSAGFFFQGPPETK